MPGRPVSGSMFAVTCEAIAVATTIRTSSSSTSAAPAEEAMVSFRVIGQPTPRVDGVAKVTGAALYAADVPQKGLLWGKALHSPHAHARITGIDTTAARALPGVHAVITGNDIGPGLYGRMAVRDIPP